MRCLLFKAFYLKGKDQPLTFWGRLEGGGGVSDLTFLGVSPTWGQCPSPLTFSYPLWIQINTSTYRSKHSWPTNPTITGCVSPCIHQMPHSCLGAEGAAGWRQGPRHSYSQYKMFVVCLLKTLTACVFCLLFLCSSHNLLLSASMCVPSCLLLYSDHDLFLSVCVLVSSCLLFNFHHTLLLSVSHPYFPSVFLSSLSSITLVLIFLSVNLSPLLFIWVCTLSLLVVCVCALVWAILRLHWFVLLASSTGSQSVTVHTVFVYVFKSSSRYFM